MGASQESQTSIATRRSIAKNFPLGKIMSRGSDNPITLHSADDQLFVRIWSVIAETLCVTVELSRTTKEAVATKVSESNACPVCITAHTMMSVVSITVDTQQMKEKGSGEEEREAKQHEQALEYADMLLEEMKSDACGGSSGSSGQFSNSSGSVSSSKKKSRKSRKFSHLSKTAKAEVALVVMLFDHMNRVVSVIMGEEMSSAMFSVPRSMARAMEKPSTIKLMSKLMSPLLSSSFKTKYKPGMTLSLFPEEVEQKGNQQGKTASSLPEELQGVLLAGVERANAVGRLVDWVKTYEQDKLIAGGLISKDMIKFLERETKLNQSQACNFTTPGQVLKWVEGCFRDEISTEMEELELGEAGKAIVMVLFLATFAPQTAYQSSHWTTLVDQVGADTARSIVAWWSLRSTLRDAKGLDTAIDANTMVQILSVAWAA